MDNDELTVMMIEDEVDDNLYRPAKKKSRSRSSSRNSRSSSNSSSSSDSRCVHDGDGTGKEQHHDFAVETLLQAEWEYYARSWIWIRCSIFCNLHPSICL